MPFEINTYEKKIFNQLTNGLTFADNTGFFDTTFTGNVEKVRVQIEYEYTWFASSEPYFWNIQSGIIESLGQDFRSEGFEVGQVFEFYNDWSAREADTPEFTAQIDSITNTNQKITFTVLSGTQKTEGPNESNVGIWADATNENNLMPSIFVSFGMPTTSEADTFLSKLDNSLQKYFIDNLIDTGGVQNMAIGTPTSGQYTGGMTIEVVTEVGKNTKRLQIKHDLIINPYYLEVDTPDVLINPPANDVKNVYSVDNSRFAGVECLRYLQEIELRQTPTDLNGRKQRIYLDGNTGWFQDNFNIGPKKFELHENSVIYNGGSSAGLIFGQSNTVQFDIKDSSGGDIPNNAPFAVYFSILPPESRYQNQNTTFVNNFVYDCAVNDEGASVSGGENGLFSNVSGTLTTVSGQEMIRVNATLDLAGTQAQYNDNFIIWAGCETPNADISDVSCNQTAKSGGAGVEELTISLQPSGGVIIFDLQPYSQKDKFEILHNGVKVRTTSMISANNGGVYDPANDATNYPDTQWYIGGSGTPSFYADFEADTGITTLPLTPGFTQRIWWQYTPAEYAVATTITFRATGVGGTKWDIKRICE